MDRYIFMQLYNARSYFYDMQNHTIMVFIPDSAAHKDKRSLLEVLSISLTGFISSILYILYRRFTPPDLHVSNIPAVLAACLTGFLLALLTARAVNKRYRLQCSNLRETNPEEAAVVFRVFRKNIRTVTITLIALIVLVVLLTRIYQIEGGSIVEWFAYIIIWYLVWVIVCVIRLDRRWLIIQFMKGDHL